MITTFYCNDFPCMMLTRIQLTSIVTAYIIVYWQKRKVIFLAKFFKNFRLKFIFFTFDLQCLSLLFSVAFWIVHKKIKE